MSDTPWESAQAAGRRNGLDGLIVYTHACAHHAGNPLDPRWADQCEAAAVCLLDSDRVHRAVRDLLEVTP